MRDSSALVFVSLIDGVYKVERERVWQPSAGEPLRPNVVLTETLLEVTERGAASLCADSHYWAAVLEILEGTGVEMTPFPSDQMRISEVFVRIRVLLGMGKVDLSLASERLLAELKATTGKPMAGGWMSIQHPRRGNSHGDCARAFAAAVFALELGGAQQLEQSSAGQRRMQSARRYRGEPERRPGYLAETADEQYQDDPDKLQRTRAM